jgi:phospholipase C
VANASGVENNTVIGDPDPKLDDCAGGTQVTMSGRNIGDLLNAHGVSWGFFEGGFRPSSTDATGKAHCDTSHANVAGGVSKDYIPHHQPFMYYASTTNPHHLAPSSPDKIGLTDQANHQYDLTDFDTALANHELPAVSFVKASQFEDGHPGNSDPIDEQRFIARTLNALEASPEWSSTAVVIAYDDSDGWYDHQMAPFVNGSDATSDAGHCGTGPSLGAYQDRCGYGQRQPLLVISPYAKQNFVDNTLTDQTSVLKFIEDNWSLGRIGDSSFDERAGTLTNMFDFSAGAAAPKVFLDTSTGQVTRTEAMPGTEKPPTPTNTVTVTQTQTVTTPAPAPKPVVKPVVKAPTLKCKVTSARGKVAASCVATGGTKGVKVAVRFRLTHGGKTLITKATTVKTSKASATLKAKAIKKGKYVLYVTVTPAGGSAHASHLTVTVK